MRRRPRMDDQGLVIDSMDQDGLSLFDASYISVDECIEQELSCHGLVTHHVGTLRALGLEVIRDPLDSRKVLITNLPFENPGDQQQEKLADRVASKARIASRRRWKRN